MLCFRILSAHVLFRANAYGESERVLGDWLKRTGKRSEIFLATKFGFTEDLTIRGDAEFVKQNVEYSLKTLGVDYIDLLYLHRWAPTILP